MLWSPCKQWIQKGISMNARACAFPSLFLFVCVCVCVGWGGATQTEATLISVLESNLACVQNGSLYQLGGSVPCLESGGSRSSSSDAFLMTAQREQPDDHLLQRPAVCWGRTRKTKFMCYNYWSNSDPSYEWPVSIVIILKATKVVMFGWLMSCWGKIESDSYRFCIDLCLAALYLHYKTGTTPKGWGFHCVEAIIQHFRLQ